jgi:hypothetical protein
MTAETTISTSHDKHGRRGEDDGGEDSVDLSEARGRRVVQRGDGAGGDEEQPQWGHQIGHRADEQVHPAQRVEPGRPEQTEVLDVAGGPATVAPRVVE